MKSGGALESVDFIVVVFNANLLWTSVAIITNKFAEMLSCTLFSTSNSFLQNLKII